MGQVGGRPSESDRGKGSEALTTRRWYVCLAAMWKTYLFDDLDGIGHLIVGLFAEDACAVDAASALARHASLVIIVSIDLGQLTCITSRGQLRRLLRVGIPSERTR